MRCLYLVQAIALRDSRVDHMLELFNLPRNAALVIMSKSLLVSLEMSIKCLSQTIYTQDDVINLFYLTA